MKYKHEDYSMTELLLLKEEFRVKHGLHIENSMGERGSMNHKTKPYWGCVFIKRIPTMNQKGRKHNARTCYQTFDTYKEALLFSLDIAKEVNDRYDLKGYCKKCGDKYRTDSETGFKFCGNVKCETMFVND